MIILYIILIAAAALPLFAFLYKRKEYYHLTRSGVKTAARVSRITTHRRSHGGGRYDTVVYSYLPVNGNQYYSGVLISKVDEYKLGDELDLYYLPDKPEKKALAHVKYNVAGFLFVLGFFLAVLFACYKIHQMVSSQ